VITAACCAITQRSAVLNNIAVCEHWPTETKQPATWNRVLLENRTVPRFVKKFPTRYGTLRCITFTDLMSVCPCIVAYALRRKPTRCHCMLYCTYETLNVFRALLCQSSGALDYMYATAAYGVQCLIVGCRSQLQGSRVCVQEEGCCSTAHHRRQ
jgi:hypothetical protein